MVTRTLNLNQVSGAARGDSSTAGKLSMKMAGSEKNASHFRKWLALKSSKTPPPQVSGSARGDSSTAGQL